MISMFSKIKNHALATGYQNNAKTNTPTSTTNTSSTSGDQCTSSTTVSKSGAKTATLNSISSNINSLQQNAACTSSFQSSDNFGKTGNQQKNFYGRSGVNMSSKIRSDTPDHHSSSSSLHTSVVNLSSGKNSIRNSSALSGSLGSGQQYSSAFPVSNRPSMNVVESHLTQPPYSATSLTKSNAGNATQLNTSASKKHRNSSAGLHTNKQAQSASQQQQKVQNAQLSHQQNAGANLQQNNQTQTIQQSQQQNIPQQTNPVMPSASPIPPQHQSSAYQNTQQIKQQQQQYHQTNQTSQVQMNNNYNPFTTNYQQQNYQQMMNVQQSYMSQNAQNMTQQQNVQNVQPLYNQAQQYAPMQSQLMAPNLQAPHMPPNVSPNISPKNVAQKQDQTNLTNMSQQQIPLNQYQLILFQQQQQQQQKALQNQQPGISLQINLTLPPLLQQNKISQFFEIQSQITGTSGPRLSWNIFPAIRKCDLKPASVFYFEKKSAERLHKPKRRESVVEILRREALALDRFRHPRILNLIHPLEENADTLAYATEPIVGSLANAIGYLEQKQQNAKYMLHNMELTDIEIAYGLLQIIEALTFLQYTCNIIHRNISPQSILINSKGTWKLGKPIMLSYWKCAANYNRQVEMVIERAKQILPIYLGDFRECALKTLELDHRKRQNCQTFLMTNYFQQPAVQALHYLDVVQFKDALHKSNFYLKISETLQEIPKKLWWQHVLPTIKPDITNFSVEMPSASLQPFLTMLQLAEPEEVQEFMMPILNGLFSGCALRSVQAHVTLLESLHIISTKLTNLQTSQLLWPMLFNALDSTSPQIQCAALNAVAQIIEQLDPYTIRKNVIPKTKIFFENNANVITQSNALLCIEKVIDSLNKTEILDDILPMLVSAKSNDPIVLMPLLRIYKQMMCDKRYGLTVNILATKVLPALTPVVVSPNLKLEEFSILVDLLQEMLEHVSRNQRNKLKLEKFSVPSCDKSQLHRNQDQPIGYPHRAPALRLDCRRTSISVDDVNRRPSLTQYQFNNMNGSTNNSGCNSPDSNLLQVTQQLLAPGRRHSDNTIQPPKILVQDMFGNLAIANSSRASSVVNLNILRRHSAAADVHANNSIYNAAFNPNASGIDFMIPNFNNSSNLSTQGQMQGSGRRYSMVNYGQQYNQNKMNAPNLFQTLGSQLFGK